MRKPTVAGSFYSGSAPGLRRQIEDCFQHTLGPGGLPSVPEVRKKHLLGLVSPHAGYIYSGAVAAHGFSKLASEGKPETIVILGPNHGGTGAAVALSKQDKWQTPLGLVEVDIETGEKIVSEAHWAQWDELAHSLEHSIEVQIPLLQYIYGTGFRIVPITMLHQNLEVSRDLGQAIATALRDKDGVVIASTDFTHYESQSAASQKDGLALEAILNLDPEQLARVVTRHHISMCGPGPVMTMLTACQQLGAKKARLLRYATSGDITGDYSEVVGYASVAVTLS